jgi:hypothetical protein
MGDKHKTRRQKGVFYLLNGLACDLEPMAPEARHRKLEAGFYTFFSFKHKAMVLEPSLHYLLLIHLNRNVFLSLDKRYFQQYW